MLSGHLITVCYVKRFNYEDLEDREWQFRFS